MEAAKSVAKGKHVSLSYGDNFEEARERRIHNRRFHDPREDGREFSKN